MQAKKIDRTFLQDGLGLAFFAILITIPPMFLQLVPGYMDAEYYFMGGLNLFQGNGFYENALWNTLILPDALPMASHLYWMPLPSILASWGMMLFQSNAYVYARFFFTLFAALIPVITFGFTYRISKNRAMSITAGFMAVFSGMYLVYLSLVESFSPYMLFGGLIIFLAYYYLESQNKNHFVLVFGTLGLLSGLMHLSRADGILWVVFVGLLILYRLIKKKNWLEAIGSGLCLLAGYLGLMLPWYLRNFHLFQGLFPPSNQSTLFLLGYNDNFLYPAGQLALQRWLDSGWQAILTIRLQAVGANLLTTLMIHFNLLLLPFFILYLAENRKSFFIRWVVLCYSLQFIFMSVLFPFAGMRGGFFHSGSAFQIFFWVGSSLGLYAAVGKLMLRRRQSDERIYRIFSVGILVILLASTILLYQQKVFGKEMNKEYWQQGYLVYTRLNQDLISHDIPAAASVFVNNPPGFFLVSQRKAVVVPNASIDEVHELAKKYEINYLILDEHIVPQLADFYQEGASGHGFDYLFASGSFKVYRVE